MITTPDQIRSQAYQVFVDEASEMIEQVGADLILLRQDEGFVKIHRLIQATHAIRMRSQEAGLMGIEILAQLLESTFQTLYRQGIEIDSGLEDLLLEAYFCLRLPLLSQVRSGRYNRDVSLAKAKPIFTQLEAILHSQIERVSELPTAADLGMNVMQTLFREDVSEQLEQLQADLEIADGKTRRSLLQRRAEDLLKLGEVLDLPMFMEVCCSMLTALQIAPEQDCAIAQLAQQDLEVLQTAILQAQPIPQDIPSAGWAAFIPTRQTESTSSSLAVIQRQLSTRRLFACWVDGVIATIPCTAIAQIVLPTPDQVNDTSGERFLHWRSQMLPVYRFVDLIGGERAVPKGALPMVVIRQDQQAVALELRIDRLITEQALEIQPLSLSQDAPVLHGYMAVGGDLIPVVDSMALLAYQSPTRIRLKLPNLPAPQAATILIVDDYRAVRQIVELDLERAGYRVLQAQDVPEALDLLQKNPGIQLILCDIEMPELDGFDLLRACKSDRQLATIPVIMLSSRTAARDRQLATHLGARAYLTKPYVKEELLGIIRQILGGRHAESE